LALYKSEQKNLGDIDVRYESFRPIANYDYAKPPHEGKLWYERFQWVPFRHPRVDFTKSATVSKAIMEFLGTR
jgi:N-acetylglucosamine malate deacetylase 1